MNSRAVNCGKACIAWQVTLALYCVTVGMFLTYRRCPVADSIFYFLCGTRRVVRRGPQDYRVVCASCLGGGTVRHAIPEDAERAAVRDSAKPCLCRPSCGGV